MATQSSSLGPKHQPPARVAHQKVAPPATSFLSKTLPDITKDAVILGVCPVDLNYAAHDLDGWQLADMLAFNYLLKRASQSQKWLCATTASDAFAKHGSYVHGNPFKVRKVVLDQRVLDTKEHTPFIVIDPARMKERVLQEIRAACSYAKLKQKPLLLFFFAHGKERTYSIQLNPDDFNQNLTIAEVKKTLDPKVPTTITTTCCYSGGWTINPNIHASVIAAASPKQESWSWNASVSGRFSGGIFASSIIQALCDETSPLLEPSLPSEMSDLQISPSKSLTPKKPIQPQDPTSSQVDTYNAFLTQVNHFPTAKFSQSCRHEFHFSAEEDGWEQAWGKRTGYPLDLFKKRWDQLEDHYGQQSLAKDEDSSNSLYSDMVYESERDQDKRTPDTPFLGPVVSWGHVRSGSATQNQLSHLREKSEKIKGQYLSILGSKSGLRRLRLAAKRHVTICPEDWRGGASKRVLGLFKRFIEGEQSALIRQYEVLRTLAFREDAMEFADVVVNTFNLQRPPGSNFCADWPQYSSLDSAIKYDGGLLYQRYQWCRDKLGEKGCDFEPMNEQGPYFEKPVSNIAAALAKTITDKEKSAAWLSMR